MIRQQREREKAAEELRRFHQDQLEAQRQYRQLQAQVQQQRFDDAMTRFNARTEAMKERMDKQLEALQQAGTQRERANKLREMQVNELIDRNMAPKTTVGANHAVTRFPDGTLEVTPLDSGSKGGLPAGQVHVGNTVQWFNPATGKMEIISAPTGWEQADRLDYADANRNIGQIHKLMLESADEKQKEELTKRLTGEMARKSNIRNKYLVNPSAAKTLTAPPPQDVFKVNPPDTLEPSGAAPSIPTFEPAPLDPKSRKVNQTYLNRAGKPVIWRDGGWEMPGATPVPSSAPLSRVLASPEGILSAPELDTGGYDAIRQLTEPDDTEQDPFALPPDDEEDLVDENGQLID